MEAFTKGAKRAFLWCAAIAGSLYVAKCADLLQDIFGARFGTFGAEESFERVMAGLMLLFVCYRIIDWIGRRCGRRAACTSVIAAMVLGVVLSKLFGNSWQ